MIKTKSIYAKPSSDDGKRILIDRFWPEGLKTREARVDDWIHELAPSYDLQRFSFSYQGWDDYKSRYENEVLSSKEKHNRLRELADNAENGTITLLYGGTDSKRNHATILKGLIENDTLQESVT